MKMKLATVIIATFALSGCVSTPSRDFYGSEAYIKTVRDFHAEYPEFKDYARIDSDSKYTSDSLKYNNAKKKYIVPTLGNRLAYSPSSNQNYSYGEIRNNVRNTVSEFVEFNNILIWCDGSTYSINPGKHTVLSSGAVEYRVNSKIGKTSGSVIRTAETHVVSMKYGAVPKYFVGVNEAVFALDGYSTAPEVTVKPKELGNFVNGLPTGKCEQMKKAFKNATPIKQFRDSDFENAKTEYARLRGILNERIEIAKANSK